MFAMTRQRARVAVAGFKGIRFPQSGLLLAFMVLAICTVASPASKNPATGTATIKLKGSVKHKDLILTATIKPSKATGTVVFSTVYVPSTIGRDGRSNRRPAKSGVTPTIQPQ